MKLEKQKTTVDSLETLLRDSIENLEAEFDYLYAIDNEEKLECILNYFRNIPNDEETDKRLDKALLQPEGLIPEDKNSYKRYITLIMALDAYEYYSYLKTQDILLNRDQESVLKFLSEKEIKPKDIIKAFNQSDVFATDIYINYQTYSKHNDVFLRHIVRETCDSQRYKQSMKIFPLVIWNYMTFLKPYELNFKTQTLIDIMEMFNQGLSDIKASLWEKYQETDVDSALYNAAFELVLEDELIYRDEEDEIIYDEDSKNVFDSTEDEYEGSVFNCLDDEDIDELFDDEFNELQDKVIPLVDELYSAIADDVISKSKIYDAFYVNRIISLLIKEAYKYLYFNALDPDCVIPEHEKDLKIFIEDENNSIDDLIEAFKTDKDFAVKIVFYYIKMKSGNVFSIPRTKDYDDTLKQFYNSKQLVKVNKYISKGYVNQ